MAQIIFNRCEKIYFSHMNYSVITLCMQKKPKPKTRFDLFDRIVCITSDIRNNYGLRHT